jgi:hypothetical protein
MKKTKIAKQTKLPDTFDTTNQFRTYPEFEDYYFSKMDQGWDLPMPDDPEMELIHSIAKKYLLMLMDNEELCKDIDKNKMWQLLFKLNMLVDMDDED